MPIDRDKLLAWPFKPVIQSYTRKDAILYALGLGLGADPMDEGQLRYVYEKDMAVFPTFVAVLCSPGPWFVNPESGLTPAMMVHGEQFLKLHQSLQPEGTLRGMTRVVDVIDKGEGKGALLYVDREVYDDATGVHIATVSGTIFARADGGFGGPAGPTRPSHPIPERAPDVTLDMPTLPQQALLYRLNGDMNPLHADPAFALKAKFPRPILHGMCTWGIAAHAILKAYCDYDAAKFRGFDARFSAPVFPGETVTVQMWRDGDSISLRARVDARNAIVLDAGRASISG